MPPVRTTRRPVLRRLPVARRLARPVPALRRAALPAGSFPSAAVSLAATAPFAGFQPDPHVDYGRVLTAEGGVLIVYKDLDLRLRHTLWRIGAWSAVTGAEAWWLVIRSPVHSLWIGLGCLAIVAALNWLIVAKPVEVYRRVEVRPDALILEGTEIFWLRLMEAGRPEFRPDEDGNQILCGTYGTRLVEYLTARRFDEFDRMPEVLAAHLKDAMEQLWEEPRA